MEVIRTAFIAIPFLINIVSLFILNFINKTKIVKTVSLFIMVAFSLYWLLGYMSLNEFTAFTYNLGGWDNPFAISFYLDKMSYLFMFLISCVQVAAVIITYERHALCKPSFFLCQFTYYLGISMAVCTGDLFNLFVAVELIMMSSYGIMLHEPKKKSYSITLTSMVINFIASILFLIGIIAMYSMTGSLNLAIISKYILAHSTQSAVEISCFCLFMFFIIKSAVLPLGVWLPYVYKGVSPVGLLLIGGITTKLFVYLLLRMISILHLSQFSFFNNFMIILSLLSILLGVIAAISSIDMGTLLVYHIISQIGYVFSLILLSTPKALAISFYYLIHNLIAKAILLCVASMLMYANGTGVMDAMTAHLDRKMIRISFWLGALSLAGFPILSGFWAKTMLFEELLVEHKYVLLIISVLGSLMTMFSMFKMGYYLFGVAETTFSYRSPDGFHFCDLALIVLILPLIYLSIEPLVSQGKSVLLTLNLSQFYQALI